MGNHQTTTISLRQTIPTATSLLAASAILLALPWLLAGTPATAAPAAELHVCPGGPPTCGYATIQAAVDAAGHGDVIKVATGIYTGVQAREGITQVVYISKTVTVRGGYTTADPEANPTTLDAHGLGRVLVVSGTITFVADGLRITGGDAAGLGGYFYYAVGGGAYIKATTATFSNCIVYSNTASTGSDGSGGGLYFESSWVVLQGNTIVSNTASTTQDGRGGGVILGGGSGTLSDNTIAGNVASKGYGGGLRLGSDALLENNTFVQNTANTGHGGGLYLAGGDVTFSQNTIISNTASTGGGVHIDGGTPTLSGNTIQHNTASTVGRGYGGSVWVGSDTILTGNLIADNTASKGYIGYGGGLYFWYRDVTLVGNTIVNNTASLIGPGYGGALYATAVNPITMTNNLAAGNRVDTQDSGLFFRGFSPIPTVGYLRHNTIASNLGSGQGVFAGDLTTLAFTNTIIVDHST